MTTTIQAIEKIEAALEQLMEHCRSQAKWHEENRGRNGDYWTSVADGVNASLRELRVHLEAARQEEPDPYGVCPHCGGKCVLRERRPDGNDTCENGHVYPSREAVR